MNLSIIIATYGRDSVLCNTIDSVLKSIKEAKNIDSEVIIVDQTLIHDNETTDYLSRVSKLQNVKYRYIEKPNLPNARNIGIVNSIGEILLFIDDDVILQEGFINAIMDSYSNNSISSVVGRVKLVNETGENVLLNNQSALKSFCRKCLYYTLGERKAFTITNTGFILSAADCDKPEFVDAGRGCCMSFRRSVFNIIGYFDINYRGNALREETDLFCRIKKARLQVYFNPKMFLYHIMCNTGGCRNDSNLSYWEVYFFNQCYFYIKNFNFSRFRIKTILIFDIIRCRNNGIDICNLIDGCYDKARDLLST